MKSESGFSFAIASQPFWRFFKGNAIKYFLDKHLPKLLFSSQCTLSDSQVLFFHLLLKIFVVLEIWLYSNANLRHFSRLLQLFRWAFLISPTIIEQWRLNWIRWLSRQSNLSFHFYFSFSFWLYNWSVSLASNIWGRDEQCKKCQVQQTITHCKCH